MNVLKFRCSSCAAIVSFKGPCERCAREDSLNRIMAPYEKPLLKCKAMRPEGLYYGEWNGHRDYRTGKRLAHYLFGFFAQLCTGGTSTSQCVSSWLSHPKAMRPEGLYYGEWNGQVRCRTGKQVAHDLFGFFVRLCTGGRRHDVPACMRVERAILAMLLDELQETNGIELTDKVLALYDGGHISRDQANALLAEPERVEERERMEAQMAADYARLLGSEWEEP